MHTSEHKNLFKMHALHQRTGRFFLVSYQSNKGTGKVAIRCFSSTALHKQYAKYTLWLHGHRHISIRSIEEVSDNEISSASLQVYDQEEI